MKVDGTAHFESARIDGASFWEFDTSKSHLRPFLIVGCTIYAKNLAKSEIAKPCRTLEMPPSLGVAPARHLFLPSWLWLGLWLFYRECTIHSHSVLLDLLYILPFHAPSVPVLLGLVGFAGGTSIPALFRWFHCRCLHFCSANLEVASSILRLWGFGWVDRCSRGNGASIPVYSVLV